VITRDFLLRQLYQLTQVLAAVLAGKRAGRAEEAQRALAAGLADALGPSLPDLRRMEHGGLLALCEHAGTFSSEKALAVADLLREDASASGRERAAWLYEAALDAGDLVPLDIRERLADLRASLDS
jgi:hypothetical protein